MGLDRALADERNRRRSRCWTVPGRAAAALLVPVRWGGWPAPGRRAERLLANRSMSRRVRAGAMRAWPSAAALIPKSSSSGRACLSRNPVAPGAQRVEDVLVEVERGEHHHLDRVGPERDDTPGRLDAVKPGHPHVHQHDVGPRPCHLADRGDAVPGLADHLEVGLGLDEHADTRRTSVWSSATRTRIVIGLPAARRGPRIPRRDGGLLDAAAEQLSALGQARSRACPAPTAAPRRSLAGGRGVVLHHQAESAVEVAERHAGRGGAAYRRALVSPSWTTR